jgi:Ca2+/H+ antiporter
MRGVGSIGLMFILSIFMMCIYVFVLWLSIHTASNTHGDNHNNIANTTNSTSSNLDTREKIEAIIIILLFSLLLALVLANLTFR